MGLGDWDWCIYAIDTWYKIDNYENLLYSTEHSTQCSLVTQMGRKSKKKSIYIYMYLEEGMATLSSIFSWRIPWTKEHGRLQSMGSQRGGHD